MFKKTPTIARNIGRGIKVGALIVNALTIGFVAQPAAAQVDSIPEEMRAEPMPTQHLSGPRFGLTTFSGDIVAAREAAGQPPVMSQFGWQFETQIVATSTGHQALLEWVVLAGGVENNDLSLSLNWLAGVRLPSGVEFGAGPNISMRKEGGDPTTSMVAAAGMTVQFGEMRAPLNFAVAFTPHGKTYTMLAGWVVG